MLTQTTVENSRFQNRLLAGVKKAVLEKELSCTLDKPG